MSGVFDVVVVGGGPAGLSAALIHGRCRRSVLLCDAGRPRNSYSYGLHGYLTRDGLPPAELLRLGRAELAAYPSIEFWGVEIERAARVADSFHLHAVDGRTAVGRKLLLATGVVDDLPSIAGFSEYYGRGVHHCPICDGWEVRDQPLAAFSFGIKGLTLALQLTQWSSTVSLLTDGQGVPDDHGMEVLRRRGVNVYSDRVIKLEGGPEGLRRVHFQDGSAIEVRALFFQTGHEKRSVLAEQLGCARDDQGCVETHGNELTKIPGVYAAGDLTPAPQLVIVAAAEGARAAIEIQKTLLSEDIKRT